MNRLIEHPRNFVSNGAILRFPAKWPYEDVVDLMLTSMPDHESEFGLVVTTGQKAGLVLVKLPSESESQFGRGVRLEWLISNWEKWIYPECDVSEVLFLEHYPAASL
ncbi:Imm45 family immunity protein [Pseudomonas sp. NPDC089401]|uniref:Imm45 family immunity protein n=1 Tax=Pseudomonas sp. NPDC089401 TaxID=3364462 RepID=UPI0038037D68